MSKKDGKKFLGFIPIKTKDHKVNNNEEFKKILKGEYEEENNKEET